MRVRAVLYSLISLTPRPGRTWEGVLAGLESVSGGDNVRLLLIRTTWLYVVLVFARRQPLVDPMLKSKDYGQTSGDEEAGTSFTVDGRCGSE